jgi:hypothetical protein
MDLLAQRFADAKVTFFGRCPYRRLRIFDVEAGSVDAAYRPYMHPVKEPLTRLMLLRMRGAYHSASGDPIKIKLQRQVVCRQVTTERILGFFSSLRKGRQ